MKKTVLNVIAVFAIISITLTTTSCEWLKKTFGGKSADPKDSINVVDSLKVDSLKIKGDSANVITDTVSIQKDSVQK